jgi:hypothetical protein
VVLSQSFVGTALDRHLLVVRLPSVCLGAACQTSNIACSLRLAWQTFMRSIAHFLLCCKSFNLMFSTTGSGFIDKHHHMLYNRCGWGRVEFPPPTAAPARGRGNEYISRDSSGIYVLGHSWMATTKHYRVYGRTLSLLGIRNKCQLGGTGRAIQETMRLLWIVGSRP